jgi:hypothetical protein
VYVCVCMCVCVCVCVCVFVCVEKVHRTSVHSGGLAGLVPVGVLSQL